MLWVLKSTAILFFKTQQYFINTFKNFLQILIVMTADLKVKQSH